MRVLPSPCTSLSQSCHPPVARPDRRNGPRGTSGNSTSSSCAKDLAPGPNLEDPSPRAGEPRSRKAHLDGVYIFLFRFALLAAIFLLALLIAYLAH